MGVKQWRVKVCVCVVETHMYMYEMYINTHASGKNSKQLPKMISAISWCPQSLHSFSVSLDYHMYKPILCSAYFFLISNLQLPNCSQIATKIAHILDPSVGGYTYHVSLQSLSTSLCT